MAARCSSECPVVPMMRGVCEATAFPTNSSVRRGRVKSITASDPARAAERSSPESWVEWTEAPASASMAAITDWPMRPDRPVTVMFMAARFVRKVNLSSRFVIQWLDRMVSSRKTPPALRKAAGVAELVDARDSKSRFLGSMGSIPIAGIYFL